MTYFKKVNTKVFTEPHGSINFPIFTYETAPIDGVCASDAVYMNNEYPPAGVHDDHEGFFVYSGEGYAKVGEEEQDICAGTCFYAPAGVKHQIKKNENCKELRIFLFHFK